MTNRRIASSSHRAVKAKHGRIATVVSIGYERRSTKELLSVLHKYNVRKLIDVREVAISRRKEFRRTFLSQSLVSAGIQYEHFSKAGNPYRQNRDNIKRCLKLYAAHLRAHPSIAVGFSRS